METSSVSDVNTESASLLTPSRPSRWTRLLPWLVLTFGALDVILLGGKRRAFGAFVSQLKVEFNNTISLPELNWIGDSYAALGYLTVSFSTALILNSGRRFREFQVAGSLFILVSCVSSSFVPTPHWLFFTHTILHGIGSSLVLSVVGLIVNEYFSDDHPYRILATTLVSGGSVGSIVFVELYAVLIQDLGWRSSFVVLGVLYFVILMIGVSVFRRNEELGDYVKNTCGWRGAFRLLNRRRIPLLLYWIVDRVITSIVTYGLLMNLTDFSRQMGNTLVMSAGFTSLFTLGEACTYVMGAVVMGLTKDFFKDRLRYILICSTAVLCLALCLMEALTWSTAAEYCLGFVSGFALGPSITFLFPAGQEISTLPGHMAYPFSLGGMGLGMMISPALSAVIAQRFQYKWFFLTQGGLTAIKLVALVAAAIHLSSCPPVEEKEEGDKTEMADEGKDKES